MRVLIIADLHLDFWSPEVGYHPLAAFSPAEWDGLDLVILAGDLTNRAAVRWLGALAWLGQRVDLRRVHVLSGNHDVYHGALDREDELQALVEAAGARWAQRAVVTVGGWRFVCCTLWTDMALGASPETNARTVEESLNDYQLIRMAGQGNRRARAADTMAVHWDHRRWLEEQLSEPFDGETAVVTHHAPHPICLGEFAGGALASAFASDLTNLIEEHRPALWAYGHTHVPCDIHMGPTRLLNVSIGTPPERDLGRAVGDPRAGLLAW